MEDFVRENQGDALTLEVRSGNAGSTNLYKTCGFQEELFRKAYYRIDGRCRHHVEAEALKHFPLKVGGFPYIMEAD